MSNKGNIKKTKKTCTPIKSLVSLLLILAFILCLVVAFCQLYINISSNSEPQRFTCSAESSTTCDALMMEQVLKQHIDVTMSGMYMYISFTFAAVFLGLLAIYNKEH